MLKPTDAARSSNWEAVELALGVGDNKNHTARRRQVCIMHALMIVDCGHVYTTYDHMIAIVCSRRQKPCPRGQLFLAEVELAPALCTDGRRPGQGAHDRLNSLQQAWIGLCPYQASHGAANPNAIPVRFAGRGGRGTLTCGFCGKFTWWKRPANLTGMALRFRCQAQHNHSAA